MSPKERERIKTELRAEILAEFQSGTLIPFTREETEWEGIREMIQTAAEEMGLQKPHNLLSAMSNIVRETYGYRQVRFLEGKQAEKAREFIRHILQEMKARKLA